MTATITSGKGRVIHRGQTIFDITDAKGSISFGSRAEEMKEGAKPPKLEKEFAELDIKGKVPIEVYRRYQLKGRNALPQDARSTTAELEATTENGKAIRLELKDVEFPDSATVGTKSMHVRGEVHHAGEL
jgi:hypothetical protein